MPETFVPRILEPLPRKRRQVSALAATRSRFTKTTRDVQTLLLEALTALNNVPPIVDLAEAKLTLAYDLLQHDAEHLAD